MDLWVEEFYFLYSEHEHTRSLAESWLQFVQHAGALSEAIHWEDYGECLDQIARIFCSLCSFIARCRVAPDGSPEKINRLLSEIVFRKYPNQCPACLQKQCVCPLRTYTLRPSDSSLARHTVEGLFPQQLHSSEEKPVTPDEFLEMFRRIYGGAHSELRIQDAALRFFEEVGEVANAIRVLEGSPGTSKRVAGENLQLEIADVFSWICILLLKIRPHLESVLGYLSTFEPQLKLGADFPATLHFSRVLWKVYGGTRDFLACPGCGNRPCTEVIPEPDAKSKGSKRIGPNQAHKLIIAIDGPSGSGKTTVAKLLASKLGLRYVNTGAIYRAAALKIFRSGIDIESEGAVNTVLQKTAMELVWRADEMRVVLDDQDVTSELRRPEIDVLVRKISALPVVRERVLPLQRRTGASGGVVMEGRDIGTVVFPDADLKIFLDASPEVRGKRRFRDFDGKAHASIAEVIQDMAERDQRDQMREVSPLVPAKDAFRIDSTRLSVEQVVDQIMKLANNELLGVTSEKSPASQ